MQGKAEEPLARVAVMASHYGLDEPLIVESASHARAFLATSAAANASPISPTNAVTAAQAFVDRHATAGRFLRAQFLCCNKILQIQSKGRNHKLSTDVSPMRRGQLVGWPRAMRVGRNRHSSTVLIF
jgi:hypothetical protein